MMLDTLADAAPDGPAGKEGAVDPRRIFSRSVKEQCWQKVPLSVPWPIPTL